MDNSYLVHICMAIVGLWGWKTFLWRCASSCEWKVCTWKTTHHTINALLPKVTSVYGQFPGKLEYIMGSYLQWLNTFTCSTSKTLLQQLHGSYLSITEDSHKCPPSGHCGQLLFQLWHWWTHLCSTETRWTMEDSSLSTFPAVQKCQTLVL